MSQQFPGKLFCSVHGENVDQCCDVCGEPLALDTYTTTIHDACAIHDDVEAVVPPTAQSQQQHTEVVGGNSATCASSDGIQQPEVVHNSNTRTTVTCKSCNKPIGTAQKQLRVNDVPYHVQCAICSVCNVQLTEEPDTKPYVLDNTLYCHTHLLEKLLQNCAGCGKQLQGAIIAIASNVIKGKKLTFHPECYACTFCNTSLRGSKFLRIPPDAYNDVVDV
uniref:LIM/homeobox protein Lhx5 n=1 Tax=Lygus hesperus TaxID=30085 RepID=A0A0A9ZDK0_LYGHE